tara:strand:- start:107 stop:1090 length:984 start_codon:yes stop_codon:yes gene_type:complete
MKILVCGGAGYIGSHMVKMLNDNNFNVCVLDNLSTGHKSSIKGSELVEIDLRSCKDVDNFLRIRHFDAVMHFSAKSLVGESFEKKDEYFENNVTGSINLIKSMSKYSINNFIFSSSAAIFGIPKTKKIDENHQKLPINPYGETKLEVEKILKRYFSISNISSVSLRYFNAAGADPSSEIGELHEPETHLIPNILNSVLFPESKIFSIFGNDYNTVDGTCVRDYIHVNDICNAHLKSLEYLKSNKGAFNFNLGNGNGFSVLEVLETSKKVTKTDIKYKILDRRDGDPDILVADSSKAEKILGWKPEYDNLHSIISSAWNWHKSLSNND